jgi:KDEL-tailed cysteine endopeptidase
LNVFADLSQDEYRTRALGYRADLRTQRPQLSATPFLYEDTVPPKEVDWVGQNAVTPVSNVAGLRCDVHAWWAREGLCGP